MVHFGKEIFLPDDSDTVTELEESGDEASQRVEERSFPTESDSFPENKPEEPAVENG